MRIQWSQLPRADVRVDVKKTLGECSLKNYSTGIGGINALPAPAHAVAGIKMLEPGLVRIFIQEFYEVYAGEGVYNWEKLDSFMDSVAAMGAKIMASICIKPLALYPVVDENIWEPNNIEEWQAVIGQMVKRYSIERKYVTHWAIANEVNIGEDGGCPYKIMHAADYYAYYAMTIKPILEVFPQALVGGPSFAGAPTKDNVIFFDEFIALCNQNKKQLDFLSYNIYTNDPEQHVDAALCLEEVIQKHGKHINVYVTEFNVALSDGTSVEELAYAGWRAASLTASILALRTRTKLAGTFQYHAYDVYNDPREFAPFYAKCRFMARHWNDIPHRLGLFSFEGKVRPQYFIYQMLYSMTGQEVSAHSNTEGIQTIASNADGIQRVLMVNYKLKGSEDTVADLRFDNLPEGKYRFMVTRVDDLHHWDANLNMIPTEDRITYAYPDFAPSIYLPGDSVTLVTMEPICE